jgi:hypothetical protein
MTSRGAAAGMPAPGRADAPIGAAPRLHAAAARRLPAPMA